MDLVSGRARGKPRIGLRVAYGGSHLPAAARSTYTMRAADATGEPLELIHGDRPWLRFGLAFFIASIWSVTLRSVEPGYERISSELDWIGLVHGLVILLVVGVQAFLAFTALRALMQALTPGPRMVLDTERLTPGCETSPEFEIQWLLRFRGAIACWSDLERTYVLWVQASEEARQAA